MTNTNTNITTNTNTNYAKCTANSNTNMGKPHYTTDLYKNTDKGPYYIMMEKPDISEIRIAKHLM